MDIASASHAVILDNFATMSRLAEGGRSIGYRGAAVNITALEHPDFNAAVFATVAVSPRLVREVLDDLRSTGLPHCALFPAVVGRDIDSVLEEAGLVHSEAVPVMTATLPGRAPWPADLEAQRGVGGLEQHRRLVADVFDLPREVVEGLMTPAIANRSDAEMIVGLRDGEPVTTAFSLRSGSGVGVYNVATHPDHRGKGYGSAATAAVTNPWFDRGVTMATLQSSEVGVSVYESLGFRTVMHQQRWTEP